MKNRLALLISVFLLTAAISPVSDALAQRQRRETNRRYSSGERLPADKYFQLRMNDEISSKTSRVGDKFTTTVVDPVYQNGREVVPAGTTVVGRVTSVKPAGRKSSAGSIGVSFVALKFPDGQRVPIDGSLTEVASKNSGKLDEEGRLKGGSSKKRNIFFIGGGAAGGALIGAIAGGGKGAGIGAAIGAGTGVAGALLTKGKEAEVKRGTEIGMVLNQAVRL